ncbi:MAG: hypothetical protein OXB96_01005 [Candidatus Kaiserbacteria bacterium]|nr:hypothetical protein [Candidatus Kaiserbacteria bacterium]
MIADFFVLSTPLDIDKTLHVYYKYTLLFVFVKKKAFIFTLWRWFGEGYCVLYLAIIGFYDVVGVALLIFLWYDAVDK